MTDKVVIKKHDIHRAVISEVLPYEVPMIFSNYGFYKYLTKKNKPINILNDFFNTKKIKSSTPYSVKIAKPNGDIRFLAIPHPAYQGDISQLLYSNSELIVSLCSASDFTIRAPSSVTSYFKRKSISINHQFNDMDVEAEENGEVEDEKEDAFASSFFTYKGYTLLYKYFNSLHYTSLEKKFRFHRKFDISKCFPSIYTHSISWAVKGKDNAKKNKLSTTFESTFDTLMRNMNEGESHGIIVGPEFSRIFSEIILQNIDVSVENELTRRGYTFKKDYEIGRYVDDFFMFAKSKIVLDEIYTLFKEKLAEFKLYTNESKDHVTERPFITELGIAKLEVEKTLNNFFKGIKVDKDLLAQNNKKLIKYACIELIRNPYLASQSIINDFRAIVKLNKVSFEGFSGLIFSIIRKNIADVISNMRTEPSQGLSDAHEKIYSNFIVFCLDFIFYIYSMNIRVRTSFLLAQILVLVSDITKRMGPLGSSKINKKVRDETRLILTLINDDRKPVLETINVILAIHELFGKDAINQNMLNNYFDTDEESDYFTSISNLYISCRHGGNTEVKDSIIYNFKQKLINSDNHINKSELVMFYLDLMTFPYITKKEKNDLSELLLRQHQDSPISATRINKLVKLAQDHERWFIDWHGPFNVRKLLERKESQHTYE